MDITVIRWVDTMTDDVDHICAITDYFNIIASLSRLIISRLSIGISPLIKYFLYFWINGEQ